MLKYFKAFLLFSFVLFFCLLISKGNYGEIDLFTIFIVLATITSFCAVLKALVYYADKDETSPRTEVLERTYPNVISLDEQRKLRIN